MTHNSAITLLLIATLGAVAACQQQLPAESDDASISKDEISSEVYQSPGKPILVPVDVKYRLLTKPQVGQPFELELTIVSSLATMGLGYSINAESGLSVDPAAIKRNFAGKPARTPETTSLTITPLLEGRFYLRVSANIVLNGETRTRIVTIPIQVGEVGRQLESMGEVVTDDEGNPVVSLPAKEN